MTDVIVTIRLPEGMLEKLKKAAESEHFMDISESVRSIARRNWLAYSDPYLFEVKKLRQEIAVAVREKSRKIAAQMLADELKKLKRGIINEEP